MKIKKAELETPIKDPVVFMFAGQGSQTYQMGKELFERHPAFQKWMRKLDRVAHDLIKTSVLGVMYDNNRRRSDPFTRTLYTHPAIFMVEYSLAQVLIENGIEPDYVLGVSLGELTAAAVAGVMNVENMFSIVIKQAEAFEKHCPPGGMTAILHSPDLFNDAPLFHENIEFAGQNFDSHFVASGSRSSLKRIEDFLREQSIACQSLPVSQAFHSALIDPAKAACLNFTRQKRYKQPGIAMVSCTEADEIKTFHQAHPWRAVRKPIAFQKTIQALERRQPHLYVDVGPSGTLANFAKYNLAADSRSHVLTILTPFGGQSLKNLEKATTLFPVKRNSGFIHKEDEKKSGEEKKMISWVFPGQGSQTKGMGGNLFMEFADLTAQADAILGYSLKELCMEDPQKQLNLTQYTQPALFVVNALSYLKRVEQTGRKPDFVAGHSLGEYNALFAAGGIDFETGVKLVKKRGELMGQATGGAMAAVVKLSEQRLMAIIRKHQLANIDVANYNSPSQIVISGLQADIERAKKYIEVEGGMFIPLKVSAAFHSRYMQPAREEFHRFLQQITFAQLHIPVISNVTARPYKQSEIAANLARQITHPVKWTESIRYLMGKGKMEFEEVGMGAVLTNLIKNIRKEAQPLITPEKATPIADRCLPQHAQQSEDNKRIKEADTLESASAPCLPEKSEAWAITPASLGDNNFKQEYNLKYAYLTGAMVRGIASKELVVKMGKAGMMGYLGTGGMDPDEIEEAIGYIQRELTNGQAYGMNLLANVQDPRKEDGVVDLYLKHGVRNVEAAAYMQITPSLVRYWLKGLKRKADGSISATNRIMAKVSRPELAKAFLSPATERIVKKLQVQGKVTSEEAQLARQVPMATAICVEADSGGHTDQGNMAVLLPAIMRQRNEMVKQYGYHHNVWVGAAGGIGTPQAAATAFMLGADFILTGSINQCTVEAGNSDAVKDILQGLNVQDTDYAPAADMFELGAKVQVVRKGVFFPARANKLYDLYRMHNSWEEIDAKTRRQIQEKYFMRGFDDVWAETEQFFTETQPRLIENAQKNPKHKMALVFRWYLAHTMQLALAGETDRKVDFQIHCGPALGAFNQWVKGTGLEDWRNRHVDEIAEKLMLETSTLLSHRFQQMQMH